MACECFFSSTAYRASLREWFGERYNTRQKSESRRTSRALIFVCQPQTRLTVAISYRYLLHYLRPYFRTCAPVLLNIPRDEQVATHQDLSFTPFIETKASQMGLLRYQIFLVYLVGLISLWISLRGQKSWVIQTITPLIPESYSTSLYYPLESIVSNLIDYAPILFILALGVYALLSVAYGVFMLRDCPEASKELEHQIQQAREDMIRRGIMKHVKA